MISLRELIKYVKMFINGRGGRLEGELMFEINEMF